VLIDGLVVWLFARIPTNPPLNPQLIQYGAIGGVIVGVLVGWGAVYLSVAIARGQAEYMASQDRQRPAYGTTSWLCLLYAALIWLYWFDGWRILGMA
jgi:hypothetical protein